MDSLPPSFWVAFASLTFTVMVSVATGAFMLGRISQRVTHLEKSVSSQSELIQRVVTMEADMRHANATLGKLDRDMDNVSRQLANIAMGRVGDMRELP